MKEKEGNLDLINFLLCQLVSLVETVCDDLFCSMRTSLGRYYYINAYQPFGVAPNLRNKICVLCFPVFDAYEKITEMSVEDSIKHELSGDFERLMLAVGKKH